MNDTGLPIFYILDFMSLCFYVIVFDCFVLCTSPTSVSWSISLDEEGYTDRLVDSGHIHQIDWICLFDQID